VSNASSPPRPAPAEPSADDRLESWKEIAAHLRREVRTVQRWEKKEGLPVHRHLHDKLGSVYAYKSELDAWWKNRRPGVEEEPEPVDEPEYAEESVEAADVSADSEGAAAAPPAEPAVRPKPKEMLRHPVKALRRPVGVPLGILLVLLVVAGYVVWKLLPPRPGAGSRPMIAVLPFDNLSGDPEQEFLPDGLTEEMISQLQRLSPEGLGVIARQSSIVYKNSTASIGHIGQALKVNYILDGSVRFSKGDATAGTPDRVRVTAQLIQVNTGAMLWSQSYERDLRDVLAVQSDVAQAIASEIQLKLAPPVRARLASPWPVNPEAYQDYLKGRYQLNRRALESMQHGLDYFGRAVAADPNFALAYVGIADTYDLLGFYGALPPKVAYPEAKKAAQKALSLDDSLAEAYTTLADVLLHYDYDWQGAEQGFRSAIQRNPNYPVAHHWYAVLLALSGRFAESLAEIDRAIRLDPASLAISGDLALHHFYAGQFDQTIEQSKKCLELDPNYHMCHVWLARAYVEKKLYTDAIAEFRRAIELQPENLMAVALLGHAYALAGQTARAREVIRNLEKLSSKRYVGPSLIALVYTGLGEMNRAFQWAERAYQERDPLLTRIKLDPIVAPFRADPRFPDLLRRVGPP